MLHSIENDSVVFVNLDTLGNNGNRAEIFHLLIESFFNVFSMMAIDLCSMERETQASMAENSKDFLVNFNLQVYYPTISLLLFSCFSCFSS